MFLIIAVAVSISGTQSRAMRTLSVVVAAARISMLGVAMAEIKIIQGDCLEVMKTFEDNQFDLVLTDPPYQFETKGGGIAGKREYLHTGCKNIGVGKDYDLFGSGDFLNECVRVVKKPNIFIFCSKAQIFKILWYAERNNINYEIIPFCKSAPLPCSNNQWLPDREWGIHLYKNLSVYGNYYTKQGFFFDGNFKDENIDHPTPKPVYIIKKLLANIAEANQEVLDPFAGSGSTGIACNHMGNNCTLIEINPKYCDQIRKRIQEEQDKMALFPD